MTKRYAQILAGVVVNVIAVEEKDEAALKQFAKGYDAFLDVTDQYVGPGFTYEDKTFRAPKRVSATEDVEP